MGCQSIDAKCLLLSWEKCQCGEGRPLTSKTMNAMTCCAGCNDHCMQNVKGWKDNEGVQCLMSFPGGYIPSGTPRNTAHVPDNGLAPLRRSTSVSSFQSSLSSASVAEDINKPRPPPVPPNNVNVSFNGEARKSSRQMLGASIADNRRRIAALLGKLSP